MIMMDLINTLFAFGFHTLTFIVTLILAFVAALIALAKGRSGLFWGVVTFFFPFAIIILFLINRKVPKLNSYLHDKPAFKGRNPVVASIMALSAIVAKADGQVTKEEVLIIRRFISQNFRMGKQELNTYEQAFEYGKTHPEEYEEFVRVIKMYYPRRDFVLAVSYLLLMIAVQDSQLTDREEVSLRRIILALGITEYEFESLKGYFMNAGNKRSYESSGFSRIDESAKIERYAKVLGVEKDADLTEIKKAYRKLAKEYHPDKAAAEGMPEDFKKYANQRIIEINEAYAFLKEARA